MRIEAKPDGKLRCYGFNIKNPQYKDLEITFEDDSDMLISFKNAWDKASRYMDTKIGDEQIWRIYALFILKNVEGVKKVEQLFDEYTPSDQDLGEFREYLKEKRNNANKID